MKVHRDIDHLPLFKNAVVTIGTFDGVHLGHQKIIGQLKKEAQRVNGETLIITFHPHPRKVVPGKPHNVQLITTIDERIELLEQKGIDHLVIVPFTLAFSEMEPEHYVEQFLLARFRPAVVIIGYDHKFGRERKGDYKLLEDYSAKGSFELKEIPQHLIDDSTVNSTTIRNSLTTGDIENANRLLGQPFFFEGMVVRGDQRGRTIGYPTANIRIDNSDKIVPANGVYAVEVSFGKNQKRKSGMMNIGVRPTVDGNSKAIEVNIFNFDEDIYGKKIRIYVHVRLRDEKKFNGLEALKQQLMQDKEDTLKALATLHP